MNGEATDPPVADAVDVAVGFARTVRAAGLDVGADRVAAFTAAAAALDPTRTRDVYWAGRLTLCADHDDLVVYDRAFAAFFDGDDPLRRARQRPRVRPAAAQRVAATAAVDAPHDGGDGAEPHVVMAAASRREVLRTADLGTLGPDDREAAHRLIALLRADSASRRTRRHEPARRGQIDRHATVRSLLHAGGELSELRRRRHRHRARPLVLLIDISGSMEPYARGLLRFAHAASRRGAPTEVFSLGTRLTRLTGELAHRDPDRAMAEVSGRIADWSGGTRLGEGLREWLEVWGRRGLARGAVVVMMSDGWERDDPALLGEQMARLSRLAHRVVWSNPLRARPGYAPIAGGMAAALPHVDAFVDGHSVAALEHLAAVVATSAQPPGPRTRPVHGDEGRAAEVRPGGGAHA